MARLSEEEMAALHQRHVDVPERIISIPFYPPAMKRISARGRLVAPVAPGAAPEPTPLAELRVDIDNYVVRKFAGPGATRFYRSRRVGRAGTLVRIHGSAFNRGSTDDPDSGILFYVGNADTDTSGTQHASEVEIVKSGIIGASDLGGMFLSVDYTAAGQATPDVLDLRVRVPVAVDQRFAVRSVLDTYDFAIVFEVEIG